MELRLFDAFSQRFARAARNTAGTTSVTASVTTAARKKRKNKKDKGDVNRRCKLQAADWGTLIEFSCRDDVECEERGLVCADPLAICDFSSFLQCLVDLQNS